MNDEYFTITRFPEELCKEGTARVVGGKRVSRLTCTDNRGKQRDQMIKLRSDIVSECKDEKTGIWTLCPDTNTGLNTLEELCKGKKAPCIVKTKAGFEFIR